MFYNVPFEQLSGISLENIKTHSFISKECRLLQYVKNRSAIDLNKLDPDFSIYERDVEERHLRIPALQKLFQRKIELLTDFQAGKDIWKRRRV